MSIQRSAIAIQTTAVAFTELNLARWIYTAASQESIMRTRRVPLGIALIGFIAALTASTDASAGWQSRSSFQEVACGLARFAGQAYATPGPGPSVGYGPPSCWPRLVEHRVRARVVRVVKVRG